MGRIWVLAAIAALGGCYHPEVVVVTPPGSDGDAVEVVGAGPLGGGGGGGGGAVATGGALVPSLGVAGGTAADPTGVGTTTEPGATAATGTTTAPGGGTGTTVGTGAPTGTATTATGAVPAPAAGPLGQPQPGSGMSSIFYGGPYGLGAGAAATPGPQATRDGVCQPLVPGDPDCQATTPSPTP